MKVEIVDIESLIPDPQNARKHDAKNLAAIRGSIKQFEMVEPLIVRRSNNVVIGGNGRLAALKEMGHTTAPVHYVDFDDQKARALSLALNRTAELAEWDVDVLNSTLDALLNEGFEIEDIGFDADDLPGMGKVITGSKELSAEDFSEFDHKCPKCGFEFDSQNSANDGSLE